MRCFMLQFIKTLSAASVFLAAVSLISPSGNAAKSFKYAMGLFLISVIISTLNKNVVTLPEVSLADNGQAITQTAEAVSNGTAAFVVESLLEKCNIKFKKVEIITDNSENSNINITKAYIDFVNPEDFEKAKEIIKNQTGIILG